MVVFHCYVSLPEGRDLKQQKMANPILPWSLGFFVGSRSGATESVLLSSGPLDPDGFGFRDRLEIEV